MKTLTVAELRNMTFGKHDKPCRFYCDDNDIRGKKVDNWSHLSCLFVQWLIENHLLSVEKMPVPDHRGHGKDFINIKDEHEIQERDGTWKKVGSFYVDTKYKADDHIRNILSTLRHLDIRSSHFKISFRPDQQQPTMKTEESPGQSSNFQKAETKDFHSRLDRTQNRPVSVVFREHPSSNS